MRRVEAGRFSAVTSMKTTQKPKRTKVRFAREASGVVSAYVEDLPVGVVGAAANDRSVTARVVVPERQPSERVRRPRPPTRGYSRRSSSADPRGHPSPRFQRPRGRFSGSEGRRFCLAS